MNMNAKESFDILKWVLGVLISISLTLSVLGFNKVSELEKNQVRLQTQYEHIIEKLEHITAKLEHEEKAMKE